MTIGAEVNQAQRPPLGNKDLRRVLISETHIQSPVESIVSEKNENQTDEKQELSGQSIKFA